MKRVSANKLLWAMIYSLPFCLLLNFLFFGTAVNAQAKKHTAPAKKTSPSGGNWNSGLSNMMDQLESEVGPKGVSGAPAQTADSVPTVPPETVSTPSVVAPPALPDQASGETSGTADQDATASGSSHQADDKNAKDYLASIQKSGLARWPKARLPIKVYVEPASKSSGFRPEFVTILQRSFQDWQQVVPARLSFQFVADKNAAQIVCTWTDNKDDLMSNKEGGNTVVVPDAEGLSHADMKILTLPPGDLKSIPNNFMKRVTLHEVGHAIGLTGHSSQPADMMFGTIYPNDEPCALSERDKNTLLALYNADQSTIANKTLDPSKIQFTGDTSNPKVLALKLNNEAAEAMQKNQYDVALSKLEQAHKADPQNKLVSSNLGAIYSNYGAMAGMAMNFPVAENYFKKAIPLIEEGNNKLTLKQVLTNYVQILKVMNNQPEELKKMQAKLANLK